jgi:hypothetical protein
MWGENPPTLGLVKILIFFSPDIVSSIDRLKKLRAELMKELDQISQDLSGEEQKLADLPGTISTMQE